MSMNNENQLIAEQKKAFFEKYPDVKRSENIKCLNLLMKKEFAEAIIKGEKREEFRAYSKHYMDRLYDKALLDYGDKNIPDEDMNDFVDFARPLRKVERIHFHNYNNSWSMDVEVDDNWTVAVTREEVEDLQLTYDCHELDDMLVDLEKTKEKNRPIFFYFALGKILSREGI